MVQVLPEIPSFGRRFAQAVGQGASQGISQISDVLLKDYLQNKDMKRRQSLIEQIEGTGKSQQNPQQFSEQQFIDAMQNLESKIGRDLTPQEIDQIYPALAQQMDQMGQQEINQEDPFRKSKLYAASGEHELARAATEEAKLGEKRKMAEESREFQREQTGEKELGELDKKLNALEMSDLRFGRLEELFSPEHEINFPPAALVGLFTKDGEINPVAEALLSDDARESVKLLADEIQGVKDTFGSQISGFEVRQYLKRLPTLLSSPEGRRRILRDLRLMNKINRMHAEGVNDIVERYGGPGKISIHKAERIYRKENAKELAELKKEFILGDKTEFKGLPDASIYKGRTIESSKGELLKSNGFEWLPVNQ